MCATRAVATLLVACGVWHLGAAAQMAPTAALRTAAVEGSTVASPTSVPRALAAQSQGSATATLSSQLAAALAGETSVGVQPAWQTLAPQPPELAARAWLLLDLSSGQTLAASNADQSLPPASLTKLMTAYLVFEALRDGRLSLDQKLPVSDRARRQPGSRMFLEAGMRLPVDDLIKGLLVQSGNDGAVALAEGVAGSMEAFVQGMNDKARALGLDATHFANPTGLPVEGQQSTARDLGLLAQRLLHDFPEHAHYYGIRKYRYAGTPPANDSNRNLLLFRDPSVDGMKTGHVEAVGYSMVATAQREFPHLGMAGAPGPRRLLAVVLGAASEQARAAEAQRLLNWGYTAFEAVKLFEAHQAVLTAAIWKGRAAEVRLGRPQAIVVTVPAGLGMQLRMDVLRAEPLIAPLREGQVTGLLRIREGERTLFEIPLLALDEVSEAGLIGQAWDALRLWLQ
ncbi:D-alanyl-D-alanine carboxypeptidase family protein [Hylemonella gracilis]|uniref:D-alanyl-D-alanine carboxypeptidase family protein n=1 Tax=Hylemonella gracilis TaxID=80880 RepID=UPI001F610AA0|nr:D-alanyl-D-alanine carboxypeptidase family protein [Hylemonella gracilis]